MTSQEHYTSPELERLSRQYPVDSVLGELRDQWRSGRLHNSTDHWLFFREGMPCEVQGAYGQFLYDAATKGAWVGFRTEWEPRFLAEFRAKKESGTLESELATAEAMKRGLFDLVEHEGAVYAIPLERFMPFARERVQRHLEIVRQPSGL